MRCKHCGNEIKSDYKFCPFCAARLTQDFEDHFGELEPPVLPADGGQREVLYSRGREIQASEREAPQRFAPREQGPYREAEVYREAPPYRAPEPDREPEPYREAEVYHETPPYRAPEPRREPEPYREAEVYHETPPYRAPGPRREPEPYREAEVYHEAPPYRAPEPRREPEPYQEAEVYREAESYRAPEPPSASSVPPKSAAPYPVKKRERGSYTVYRPAAKPAAPEPPREPPAPQHDWTQEPEEAPDLLTFEVPENPDVLPDLDEKPKRAHMPLEMDEERISSAPYVSMKPEVTREEPPQAGRPKGPGPVFKALVIVFVSLVALLTSIAVYWFVTTKNPDSAMSPAESSESAVPPEADVFSSDGDGAEQGGI